jgi:hypothetical protein
MNPRDRFDELVGDYAEGALAPADRAEFEALCAAHPEWRAEAEDERRLVESLRAMPQVAAPAGLLAGALKKARTAEVVEVAPPSGGSRAAWRFAIAASFAGVMAIGYFMKESFDAPPPAIGAKQTAAKRLEATADADAGAAAPVEELARANKPIDAPPESDAAPAEPMVAAAPAAEAFASAAESTVLLDQVQNVAANARELPLLTREQLSPILLASAGRVIADTPFASTANAVLNGAEAPEPSEAPAADARFLVVEVAKVEDAEKVELAYAQNADLNAKSDQNAAPAQYAFRNSQRVLIPYQNQAPAPMPSVSGRGAGARVQDLAARSDMAAQRPGAVGEAEGKMKSFARDEKAAGLAAPFAAEPKKEARQYATLAGSPPPSIASAEQLVLLLRDRGGALLSETPERREAIGQSKLGKDRARQKAQGGPRFMVFVFQDAEAALAAMDLVRTMTAEAGANLNLAAAELIEHDGRLRLIVPVSG